MPPIAGIEPIIRRRSDSLGSNAEKRTEGVQRGEAAIKAEGKLVEVGLEMLGAHAVMGAVQPSLEIGENEMDDLQVQVGDLVLPFDVNGTVLVAQVREIVVAFPSICDDNCAWFHGSLYEAAESLAIAVSDRQPNPSAVSLAVRFGRLLCPPDLNSPSDNHLICHTTSSAAGSPANVGFVNLDVLVWPGVATDPIPVGADHCSAQLVEDIERRLVSANPKLALELPG
jgi:hypothetical protein